jgi:hypothetical protein
MTVLARCGCGRLVAELPDEGGEAVACHCLDCQKRTGAPYGVLVYFPAEAVTITGEARGFARSTASGGTFETFFCPECGTSLYAKGWRAPDRIGIALGAIEGGPDYSPVRSVWETRKRPWVATPAGAEPFSEGRT